MRLTSDILVWGGAALVLYCGFTLLFKLAEWLIDKPRKGKQ